MPLAWIRQNQFTSRNPRSLQRTNYLRGLENVILQTFQSYLSPRADDKTQVTLACLEAIGENAVRGLAEQTGRSFDTVKQDIGLFVPILLCERYGANRVETYRDSQSFRPGSRTRPKDWAKLSWVNRYTPHRLA